MNLFAGGSLFGEFCLSTALDISVGNITASDKMTFSSCTESTKIFSYHANGMEFFYIFADPPRNELARAHEDSPGCCSSVRKNVSDICTRSHPSYEHGRREGGPGKQLIIGLLRKTSVTWSSIGFGSSSEQTEHFVSSGIGFGRRL